MDNAIRWIILLSILLGTSMTLGSYEDQVHTISLDDGDWSTESLRHVTKQDLVHAILSDISTPVFYPKGKKNIVFIVDPALHYKDLQFSEVYIENNPDDYLKILIENPTVKAFRVELLTKNLVSDNDLRTLMKLGRKERFSIFNREHIDIAETLTRVLTETGSKEEMISTAVYLRDRINLELFVYGFSLAVLNHPEFTHVKLPKLIDTFPNKFIDKETINDLQKQVKNQVQAKLKDPIEVEIPMQYTATDREPEQKLAYFREDIEVNMHHWHWHLIFPYEGADYSFVNKDRRGELFYYMHQQMMARYGFERLSNKMPLAKRLNVAETIPEGYYPKLDGPTGGASWAGRPSGISLKDLRIVSENSGSANRVDVADLQRWTDRVLDSIKQGQVQAANGSMIDIKNIQGIDILGNIVEASMLSVNHEYYGDLHNQGHNIISESHDPDGRFKEPAGVMSDVTTAVRDPIFFRWHTFINYVFDQHKQTLPSYGKNELSFNNIEVTSLLVDTHGKSNVLHTFWEQASVQLDMDFSLQNEIDIIAKITRLQNHPFTYKISVSNIGSSTKRGTVRIYLLPCFGEHGERYPINEQRLYAIEMDRFEVDIEPGSQTYKRKSDQSTVTQPDSYSNKKGDANLNVCACGWPQHMLVPKGNAAGMETRLFVIITETNKEKVFSPKSADSCDSSSFCGHFGQKYPTSLPMGFPFDRTFKGKNIIFLEDFSSVYTNMMVQNISIQFTESRWNPLDECGEARNTFGENLQHEMSMNKINAPEKQDSELMIKIEHLETEKRNIISDVWTNNMAIQGYFKEIALQCPDYAHRRNRTQVMEMVERYKHMHYFDKENSIWSSACNNNNNNNKNNLLVITALLDWGFNVDSPVNYYDKWTCLHIAARNNNVKLIKRLLERSASISARTHALSTPLMIASSNGNMEAVKLLLENGADVIERDKDNSTSLMQAIYRNSNLEVVKFLVEKGSDLKHRNNDGETPLIIAAEKGKFDTVKFLLTKGADLKHRNNDGKTPLIIAAEKGKFDTVKLLLTSGAHMNETDNKGRTASWYALGNGELKMIYFVLDEGVDVDIQDNEGVTPLMFVAANINKFDYLVKLLVKKGADVNKANFKNKTALMYAAENRNFHILEYLIEAGANVNAKDYDGRTALILSSKKYFSYNPMVDIVTYLVENNADVNVKDKDNKTALGYAKERNNAKLVTYLISIGATE